MLYFRKFLGFALVISLIYSPLSFAQGPEAKDHPLNKDMPTGLVGNDIVLMAGKKLPFIAYEVKPKDGNGDAILLIHEWWGLNDHIRAIADQLANLGYHAVAIDLYDGNMASDPEDAKIFMNQVDKTQAKQKLTAAINYLALTSDKVATLGWCFGGGWALQASLDNPDKIAATIVYYGKLETDPKVLKKLKGPVLGIFAKKDGWITPVWVEAFDVALSQAGIPHQIYSYDADHAFANPSNKHYDPEAYLDAWDKTLTFLRENL